MPTVRAILFCDEIDIWEPSRAKANFVGAGISSMVKTGFGPTEVTFAAHLAWDDSAEDTVAVAMTLVSNETGEPIAGGEGVLGRFRNPVQWISRLFTIPETAAPGLYTAVLTLNGADVGGLPLLLRPSDYDQPTDNPLSLS